MVKLYERNQNMTEKSAIQMGSFLILCNDYKELFFHSVAHSLQAIWITPVAAATAVATTSITISPSC